MDADGREKDERKESSCYGWELEVVADEIGLIVLWDSRGHHRNGQVMFRVVMIGDEMVKVGEGDVFGEMFAVVRWGFDEILSFHVTSFALEFFLH